MDTLKVRTIAEALNYTPGVRSQAYGSDTRIDYYQIRGFQTDSLFKDGLRLLNSGFSRWTTPADGIERLEILRGPASVLYGGSGPGGLVNITTKQPDRREIESLGVGYDEFRSHYLRAEYGTRISEHWTMRAIGSDRRGLTQNTARDDRAYLAWAVGWTPTDDVSVVGHLSRQRDRAERPTGFLPYIGTVIPLDYGRIPARLFVSDHTVDAYDREQQEAGYALTWHLDGDMEFVQNARYADMDLHYSGLYGLFSGNPIPSNPRLLARGDASLDSHQRSVTIDNQWRDIFEGGPLTHELTVGVDASRNKLTSLTRSGIAPPLDVLAPNNHQRIPPLGLPSTSTQALKSIGAYVQHQIRMGESFIVSMATRRDWLSNLAGDAFKSEEHRAAATTSRIGLVRMTNNGLSPYVSYSTSFTPVVGTAQATGQSFLPESGRQVEAGIRYAPKMLDFLATADVFILTRNGILIADPVPGFPQNQKQGGRVQSQGYEIEFKGRVAPDVTLTGAFTRFHMRTISGISESLGRRPTATPEKFGSLFADYAVPAGVLHGISFGAGIRYTGSSFADVANRLTVPSAVVWDGVLGYGAGRWRAAVNVSNVFDKHYVSACASTSVCYYANIRRTTLSFDYRFN